MDTVDVEENPFVAGDAKVHGGLCRALYPIVCKVLGIFPFVEAARPEARPLYLVSLLFLRTLFKILYFDSAITGDSILMKFEKTRCALLESLRRVEDIVTEDIFCQIMEIVAELEETIFMLDQIEKEAGDDVINLLQKHKKSGTNCSDSGELEVFHQTATKLGITSSRAALTERRALKKLIERARDGKDKLKESVVTYLYNLMRKYSKLFRSDVGGDDTDSQGSTPCSPTVLSFEENYSLYRNGRAFERQLSTIRSFNFRPSGIRSGNMLVPPEEFRCPISLQLMYDPVIISSGQTYERVCIEKWFNDGHSTCPKTQQQLSHLCLTPNNCVKGLIASWCEQNGLPIPDGPPEPLDFSWRRAFSYSESMDSRSVESVESNKVKGVLALVERRGIEEHSDHESHYKLDDGTNEYQNLFARLHDEKSLHEKFRAAERIRYLLKDDEEARIYMGANGFAEELVHFLRLAVRDGDDKAQEVGAMALFNLAVNNNRNKELLMLAGVIDLLDQMISSPQMYEAATALYLNLSCLDDAKPIIGSSPRAVPFLAQLLLTDHTSCTHDALYTLYNLSSHPPNVPFLLSSGIVDGLFSILSASSEPEGRGPSWTEKALAVLINMALDQSGRDEIVSTPGLVGTLAVMLDMGGPAEQEQAAACLLAMCSGDERCIQIVLQEGVVPSLVSISVNGTPRGREKARWLLKLFREHRQREVSPVRRQEELQQQQGAAEVIRESKKPLCKSRSKKLLGRTLSSIWKNRSFSVYQC
uniref:RING-type E3 ubiquitin transferase n=1 Tax=Ananas comosus var. bracteatus TaxID=296719 RepID=A0A6V7PN26_ANACO|nr:unnamed protein product [Ananas comosus var. bracteatus]